MNRRNLLKAFGAIGLSPMLPSLPALSGVLSAQPELFARAEMIVRAHNNCSLPMLQRLLKIDLASAEALQSGLLKKGVIGAKANAYGMRQAVTPLYRGAFVKPHKTVWNTPDLMNSNRAKVDEVTTHIHENESKNNTLELRAESESELVESNCEETLQNAPESDEQTLVICEDHAQLEPYEACAFCKPD